MHSEDYFELLRNWTEYAESYIYIPPERKDLACYGPGYNTWGVQTNQKALAAFGVLAAFGDAKALSYALKLLRFSLESHIEGSYHCTDNTKWGHTWISVLGIERMMHAVDAIYEYLSGNDRELLRKVLISESDWLLNEYQVVADPVAETGENKPESNIWNGALLHRTAMMYPDCENAAGYREKGSKFLMNSISIPSDADLAKVIDGKKVSEWHTGANFFETYSLNHHGYLNVGYMVICLSNIAMLHFSYRERGIEAPEPLYHHVYDLWRLIKLCTFPDGRLLRIGGDTRVRYTYCQDYVLPMWYLMLDKYGETDCLKFEKGWFDIIRTETGINGDGSFLGERAKTLITASPVYYTRLESDKAATLSMAAYWRRKFNEFADIPESLEQAKINGSWHDEFHGACLHRSEKRVVSWVWEAAENPQGLCVPANRSDMAEWKHNLAAAFFGTGNHNYLDVISHRENTFAGGFITGGTVLAKSARQIAEGQGEDILAEQKIVFAALPDDATVICMQFAKTVQLVYLNEIQGLRLQIPNDIFNNGSRTYYVSGKEFTLKGCDGQESVIDADEYLTADGVLSVARLYGEDSLKIHHPDKRQIGIRHKPKAGGMLFADEILCPYHTGFKAYNSGEILVDIGVMLRSGATSEKAFVYKTLSESLPEKFRAVIVSGVDGHDYLLVVNFSEDAGEAKIGDIRGTVLNLVTGEETLPDESGSITLPCTENEYLIFRITRNSETLKITDCV